MKKNKVTTKAKEFLEAARTSIASARACPVNIPVCHYKPAKGKKSESWKLVEISQAGWENGHSKHEGDFVLDKDLFASCEDEANG